MKFAAIASWAAAGQFPVSFMCEQLGVSRSGYYAWLGAEPCARQVADEWLVALIRTIHRQGRGNPGVRRVHASLAALGHRLGPKRVWRLMRAAGLQGRHPRAWRRTTIGGRAPVSAPDLVERQFHAEEPNQKWCGDISYVRTWQGWAYLATVIDLHSRAVVGYALDDHMRTSLVTDALDMALQSRTPGAGVVFHSDRGAQYTSDEFDQYCTRHKITRSLGRTGICFDNAVAESFFATYKKELVHTRPWPDLERLRTATIDWIDDYYNTRRRHSTLAYLTPREYELGCRDIKEFAA